MNTLFIEIGKEYATLCNSYTVKAIDTASSVITAVDDAGEVKKLSIGWFLNSVGRYRGLTYDNYDVKE